ncbi:division/outer membrane stress-associated lipid-binding lipoprotein [Candidatus Profftia tarda]|uniref:Uncharacterized protein YraP n=1 Tax=Candidatus Profftia tarda TaxID=1177216 RepID=A0A8E4MEX0_9ENTR|nr:division/outer membrane stress-associated lipid-binding lipoprotein [Candidatus Profftia tarda]CAD6512134.1 Uncharacterized protein YraP [Candidatus Profftia tarda]
MTKDLPLTGYVPIALVIIISLFLHGCLAATVIGGAAFAAKTAIDPRSLGTQVDDGTLESRVFNALYKNKELKEEARISVTVYQGNILLTGQAPSNELITCAQQIAIDMNGRNAVYNEIRNEKPVSLETASHDLWITTKVRSELLISDIIKSPNIKVITENGEVFLLGLVTSKESKVAAKIASHIDGVKRVTTAFNILK